MKYVKVYCNFFYQITRLYIAPKGVTPIAFPLYDNILSFNDILIE